MILTKEVVSSAEADQEHAQITKSQGKATKLSKVCVTIISIFNTLVLMYTFVDLEERDLQTYLIENKKNGMISQSMMSNDENGN